MAGYNREFFNSKTWPYMILSITYSIVPVIYRSAVDSSKYVLKLAAIKCFIGSYDTEILH